MTAGNREDVREAAVEGAAETPVGASEETQQAAAQADDTGEGKEVPQVWERAQSGRVVRHMAGPYEIEAKPQDGEVWLWGPGDESFQIGRDLAPDQVADVADDFARLVGPRQVDFADHDGVMDDAAAQATGNIEKTRAVSEHA